MKYVFVVSRICLIGSHTIIINIYRQWKLRLLVPLLAEADKHRKGQPYVAAAALAIVGDLPQAISFAKTWTTCRQLILGNIHRFNDPWGTKCHAVLSSVLMPDF